MKMKASRAWKGVIIVKQRNSSVSMEMVLKQMVSQDSGGNMFGAAGSSAGLSNSELLSLRAPGAKVRHYRPRINRYMPWFEMIKEKVKKKARKKAVKKKGKMKKCTNCGIDDHKTAESFTKLVDMTGTGL